MKSKIIDRDGTTELKLTNAKIEFTNVNFAYNECKPIIKEISFVANPSKTVALVGKTGNKKLTILKLFFWFYNVSGGAITINS